MWEDDEKKISEKIRSTYNDDLFTDITWRKIYQICSLALCEFWGCFFLEIFGCAVYLKVFLESNVGVQSNPYPPVFNIALTWGFSYCLVAFCTAQISGLCLNPAFTMSLHFVGVLSAPRTIIYLIMEIGGTLFGAFFLQAFGGSVIDKAFCLYQPLKHHREIEFVYEFVGTFMVCLLAILCYDKRFQNSFDMSPLKMGFTIFGLILPFYRLCGCSLNFAHTLAVSVVAGEFEWFGNVIVPEVLAPIVAAYFYLGTLHSQFVDPASSAE